ncbi:DUF6274 family protein [Actinacidiphila glaucinigra]|uniref:DUF6274 family protein n=1 Tax=Actinacidiphila glaucinigra TaxID=235986 RepID=UPI0036E9638B
MSATPGDPGPMPRDVTRALLRAHLAAAAGGGRPHLTRHCPACHRLMRLALRRAAAPLPQESGEEQDSSV